MCIDINMCIESFRVKAFSHLEVNPSLDFVHLSVAKDGAIALMNTVLLCLCLTWVLCWEQRHWVRGVGIGGAG